MNPANPGPATRIRWGTPVPGSLATLAGYVGTLDADLFKIFEPYPGEDGWLLTSTLPGLLGYRRFKVEPDVGPDRLKAEAEHWLEEFVSSLGAIFPPAAAVSELCTDRGPKDPAWHDDCSGCGCSCHRPGPGVPAGEE